MTDSTLTALAFSNQLSDAVEKASRSIVAVNARRRRTSSGIHWRKNLIITADHTIQQDEEINVILPDGRSTSASIAGRDSTMDIAVLRLESIDLPTAEIADSTQTKVGQIVLAVSRSAEGSTSASMGIISSISEGWQHSGRPDHHRHGRRSRSTIAQLIQPALMMYPGFSGGALINPEGQVLGINTAGARQFPLTIPAAMVDRVLDQLLQTGRIARGYLGLGMQAIRLPEALCRSLNLSNPGGVIIVSVEPDAPADNAGMLLGDILVALNDNAIEDVTDVHSMLSSEQVGQPLTAKIVRGGVLTEKTIIVGERPGRNG
ncbi:S1C family serine protease [Leptolyngbya sp. NIES-2104]|uniref:S1C family serine protease n=1 Tax=Leptolyngbya sp. NIES-2104 TaxID=1552121 RepID=UPI0006EC6E38|nr:trypsin-like peptidase domain-containing protein [Leptolyngbya sp. NIES-2104]GAP95551.1 serine protease [Leptolyngbya sp. NIES-2104]